MLRNQERPLVDNRRDIRILWFQQDGATRHTNLPVLQFLHTVFGDSIISRHSRIHWPAQSPDLNRLDYWFRGYGCAATHRKNPRTTAELITSVKIFCQSRLGFQNFFVYRTSNLKLRVKILRKLRTQKKTKV